MKVLIVAASFYDNITSMMLNAAKKEFDDYGAKSEVVLVPGTLEVPAAISFASSNHFLEFSGYLALGCIIKGGTTHDTHVAEQSGYGLTKLSIERNLAIGNGIITANNLEQALERADPARKNRSGFAAKTCIRMIELRNQLLSNHG